MAISLVLDHFRAVAQWATQNQADAQLDMQTFQLTIQWNGHGYRFHPIFPAKSGNQFVHSSVLTENAVGFGGWLPYRPYRSRWSTDKLLFKQDAARAGLRVPRQWPLGTQPDADYILKRSQGSFGYEIAGPFHGDRPLHLEGNSNQSGSGVLFGEQFVEGRMAKIWFWGAQPFFVHLQDYPLIEGDGTQTAIVLAQKKIDLDVGAAALVNMEIVRSSLTYQGILPDDVLEEGRRAWFDFRYGRTFADRRRSQDGNSLAQLLGPCGDQLAEMGDFVVGILKEAAQVPLMCSVDAVLDDSNRLWWLEINTNSTLPHHGYAVILTDLFHGAEQRRVAQVGLQEKRI